MTNNPALAQAGPNANQTIQNWHEMMLRTSQGVCSVITTPVESLLRPLYGTRYFGPIPMLFTYGTMAVLPLAGMATSHLPFGGGAPSSSGLIGLGTLSGLFFAGQAIHGPRIWRRMLQMEREQHSEFEGDALPFFERLPLGKSFWITRIFWEPMAVFLAGIALHLTLILDSPAMVYFIVVALLLAFKNFLGWYQAWLHIRILMDAKFAGPLVAKAASGKATERELAQVHMAGFPKSIPVEIRTAAIAEMTPRTPTLPPEIANLISPVETGASQVA